MHNASGRRLERAIGRTFHEMRAYGVRPDNLPTKKELIQWLGGFYESYPSGIKVHLALAGNLRCVSIDPGHHSDLKWVSAPVHIGSKARRIPKEKVASAMLQTLRRVP